MLWRIMRNLIFLFPAEFAHSLGGCVLQMLNLFAPYNKSPRPANGKCATFCGQAIQSRLGLAAGFDKDGKYIPALAWLGFGFVEVGTVTPEPQPGNPRPRLFRLPHSQALVNRLGFNSEGAIRVRDRLENLRASQGYPCPVGINIGKNRATSLDNAESDYLKALEILFPVADFFVVNLSSPNTPGLRQLLDESHLAPLVRAVAGKSRALTARSSGNPRELFLKISPDMEAPDRKRAVELALEAGFSGIIATNTTIRRDLPGVDPRDAAMAKEAGGLSGLPLRDMAAHHVAEIRGWMGTGPKLISVGGIFSLEEARRRIDAGADFLEVYTGFIYEGPGFPRQIASGLSAH